MKILGLTYDMTVRSWRERQRFVGFTLALLLVVLAGGCRSKKTPDLVRRWQVAGLELKSPAWRAINRDGDEAHGIMRLRPPGAAAGSAGLTLRWDTLDEA